MKVLGYVAPVTACLALVTLPAVAARWVERVETRTPISLEPGERALAPVSIDIKIDAQGNLVATRPAADAPAELVPIVEQAMLGWRFQPAKRDGVAVDWATRVTTSMIAVPVGDGYALKIRDVVLQSVWYDSERPMVAPAYPSEARKRRHEGDVLVLAEPHADGTGAEVISMLFNGKPVTRHHPLAKSSREAVIHWPYQVLSWDGVAFTEQVCIPFNYSMGMDRPPKALGDEEKAAQLEQCRSMNGVDRFHGIELVDDLIGRRL